MNDERLVVAVLRRDEVGPLGVEPLERLLEGGQPEEPVVLLLALELDLVDRAAVAVLELGLGLEVGAARAVPALVGALVDVAVVVDALDDLADRAMCSGSVVRMKKSLVALSVARQLLEADRVAVAELARRDAELLGRLGDRLAVLVGAREEEDVLAALAHVAREHVGGDRRVRVPEMRLAVHVVDRRRDVVRHGSRCYSAAAPRLAAPLVRAWASAADPASGSHAAGASAPGRLRRGGRSGRRPGQAERSPRLPEAEAGEHQRRGRGGARPCRRTGARRRAGAGAGRGAAPWRSGAAGRVRWPARRRGDGSRASAAAARRGAGGRVRPRTGVPAARAPGPVRGRCRAWAAAGARARRAATGVRGGLATRARRRRAAARRGAGAGCRRGAARPGRGVRRHAAPPGAARAARAAPARGHADRARARDRRDRIGLRRGRRARPLRRGRRRRQEARAGRGRRGGCRPRARRSAGAAARPSGGRWCRPRRAARPPPTRSPSRTADRGQVQVGGVEAAVGRADAHGEPRGAGRAGEADLARRPPRRPACPAAPAMSMPRCWPAAYGSSPLR